MGEKKKFSANWYQHLLGRVCCDAAKIANYSHKKSPSENSFTVTCFLTQWVGKEKNNREELYLFSHSRTLFEEIICKENRTKRSHILQPILSRYSTIGPTMAAKSARGGGTDPFISHCGLAHLTAGNFGLAKYLRVPVAPLPLDPG